MENLVRRSGAAGRFGYGADRHHSCRTHDRVAGGESAAHALRLSCRPDCLRREAPLRTKLAYSEHPAWPFGGVQPESDAVCFKCLNKVSEPAAASVTACECSHRMNEEPDLCCTW